jgi:hypothetical protein
VTKFKRPVGAWPEKLEWITTDDKKKPKGTLSSVGSFDPSDLAFLQYTSVRTLLQLSKAILSGMIGTYTIFFFFFSQNRVPPVIPRVS